MEKLMKHKLATAGERLREDWNDVRAPLPRLAINRVECRAERRGCTTGLCVSVPCACRVCCLAFR